MSSTPAETTIEPASPPEIERPPEDLDPGGGSWFRGPVRGGLVAAGLVCQRLQRAYLDNAADAAPGCRLAQFEIDLR